MNFLSIGRDKHLPLLDHILDHAPERALILDDGPFIDTFLDQAQFAPHWDVTVLDLGRHRLDPLKSMTYLRARELVSVCDALFDRGDSTLTKDTGLDMIFEALVQNRPRSLATLIPPPDKKSLPGHVWAFNKLRQLLLSDVIARFIKPPTTLSLKGTIITRLDRTVLGEFDCKFIANLLVAFYPATVVIPDFGFYAHKGHASLIRQDRLIAGINSFSEVPELRAQLELIENKVGSRCTYDDARTLAQYAGLYPDPNREDNDYNKFIAECVNGGA